MVSIPPGQIVYPENCSTKSLVLFIYYLLKIISKNDVWMKKWWCNEMNAIDDEELPDCKENLEMVNTIEKNMYRWFTFYFELFKI